MTVSKTQECITGLEMHQTANSQNVPFDTNYKYTDIAKFAGHLPHRYGNSRAIWDHTVLPATRQR